MRRAACGRARRSATGAAQYPVPVARDLGRTAVPGRPDHPPSRITTTYATNGPVRPARARRRSCRATAERGGCRRGPGQRSGVGRNRAYRDSHARSDSSERVSSSRATSRAAVIAVSTSVLARSQSDSWAAQLGHAQQHGELVVHPVLQHDPQLAHQARPREARVAAHRPDQEALKPDQEGEGEPLRTPVELGEREREGNDDAGRGEEQLEVLGDLGPKGVHATAWRKPRRPRDDRMVMGKRYQSRRKRSRRPVADSAHRPKTRPRQLQELAGSIVGHVRES